MHNGVPWLFHTTVSGRVFNRHGKHVVDHHSVGIVSLFHCH